MGSKRIFFVRPARCQKKCSVKNQDVERATEPQPHDTRSALKAETNATTVEPQRVLHFLLMNKTSSKSYSVVKFSLP